MNYTLEGTMSNGYRTQRSANFSGKEISIIHEFVRNYKDILFGKIASKAKKESLWAQLTDTVNTISDAPRSISHVKIKVKNMKLNSKQLFDWNDEIKSEPHFTRMSMCQDTPTFVKLNDGSITRDYASMKDLSPPSPPPIRSHSASTIIEMDQRDENSASQEIIVARNGSPVAVTNNNKRKTAEDFEEEIQHKRLAILDMEYKIKERELQIKDMILAKTELELRAAQRSSNLQNYQNI